MSMPNSEYWKQRFTQLEAAQNAIGEETKAEIDRIYRDTQRTIEGQITAWYERLAKNNGISMAEAKKWLRGKELKEFKWDVGDYIKYAKENAMNKAWVKELENASAKFHISRLEGLNVGLEHSLQKMFHKEESIMTDSLSDVYKEGYYRTMYELQKGFSVGFDVAKIDDNYVHKVLAKPWAPDKYNFSERIWKSKTQLINEAHKIISQNILLGSDPAKAIGELSKKLETSKLNAGRLVMTEEAYFSSLAQGDCLRDLDVEKFQILATLDDRTSDICQTMDGKVFDMKDYQPWTTCPPFHVFCRSTTVPYFDKECDITGSRAARDSGGKTYYVPGDMRYSEWEKRFVKDKTDVDKSGEKGYNKSRGERVALENQRYGRNKDTLVNKTYINGGEYRRKFDKITDNPEVNKALYNCAKEALIHRSGTVFEDMYWIDGDTGDIVLSVTDSKLPRGIAYTDQIEKAIKGNGNIITLHTHPSSMPPSVSDLNSCFRHGYTMGVVACHDGKIFLYESDELLNSTLCNMYVENNIKNGLDEYESQIKMLDKVSEFADIKIQEVIKDE